MPVAPSNRRLLAESAEKIGAGSAGSAGRWRLNAGSVMLVQIPELAAQDDGLVAVILDLESATARTPRIVALAGHNSEQVIGYWDAITFSPAGMEADLHLVEPGNDAEREVLSEAVRVGALLRAQVPIQASVGAVPGAGGRWEPVAAGATVTVNGRSYTAPSDTPCFILRGGECYESSVVTFGADSRTGRLAARRHTPIPIPEKTMPANLKALLAKHPTRHALVANLVAEDKTDAEVDEAVKAADLDELKKRCEALSAENEALKKENGEIKAKLQADDYNQGKTEKNQEQEAAAKIAASGSATGVRFSGESKSKTAAGEPADLVEGMERLQAEKPALKGFALRAAAKAKWPSLPNCSADRQAALAKFSA
jgi:hypothetical protein